MSENVENREESLLTGPKHAEYMWVYFCPAFDSETDVETCRRIYRILIAEIIPKIGEIDKIFLPTLEQNEATTDLFAEILPDRVASSLRNRFGMLRADAGSIYVDCRVRTPSGGRYIGKYLVGLAVEEALEGIGVDLMVHVHGTVFQRPEPDADPLLTEQYAYNQALLPSLLIALQDRLHASFVGRDSLEVGPDGYLEPDADQTGLPDP